jgi:hypothetical protein
VEKTALGLAAASSELLVPKSMAKTSGLSGHG